MNDKGPTRADAFDGSEDAERSKLINEALKLHTMLSEKYRKLYPEPEVKPTCKLEFMSSDKVEDLIAKDVHNRTKRPQHWQYLGGEFKAGRYVITNNAIGVSVDDKLTDGGHRLLGLRHAGYPPVWMFVARNLPVEAQKVIDLGLRRSMADVLALLLDTRVSDKVVAALHACLRARVDWLRGKWSPDTVLKELQDSMEGINKTAKVAGWSDVPAPIRAAVLDRYYESNKDDRVFKWLTQIIHGEHIGKGDPAYLFKQWNDSQGKSTGGNDMQIQRYYRAYVCLTAFLENRTMSKWNLPVKDDELSAWVKQQQKEKLRNRRAKIN